VAMDGTFFVAVLIGAIGWVVFATATGMPVSTTHAIVGGLVGAGLVAFGRHQIVWSFLAVDVAIPLVCSPFISLLLVYLLAWPIAGLARRFGNQCLCITEEPSTVASTSAPGLFMGGASQTLGVVKGTATECESIGRAASVTSATASNFVHWTSGGFVGFARGWNDAPKIAALSIVALTSARVSNPAAMGFLVVTIAMALGGYLTGRKVLDTLASKLTPLPLVESITASLTTAVLVSAASWASLPVSTTHVATGSIVGAGLKNDPATVRWSKVVGIVLSWLVTLPVAGAIAAGVMTLIPSHVR